MQFTLWHPTSVTAILILSSHLCWNGSFPHIFGLKFCLSYTCYISRLSHIPWLQPCITSDECIYHKALNSVIFAVLSCLRLWYIHQQVVFKYPQYNYQLNASYCENEHAPSSITDQDIYAFTGKLTDPICKHTSATQANLTRAVSLPIHGMAYCGMYSWWTSVSRLVKFVFLYLTSD